mmetsp:Transcript_36738/g.76500  ORF Transcript_36738/g.76500 Transcript_36738/m.76500 type:complete len:91 (-) Transcript_36738:816-1088(-)
MSGVRTYNPTTEELNTAIEKIIASHVSENLVDLDGSAALLDKRSLSRRMSHFASPGHLYGHSIPHRTSLFPLFDMEPTLIIPCRARLITI